MLCRHEEARWSWERALVVEPRHVKTMYNLGTLLFQQSRFEEARPLLERVLATDPDDQETQSILARLADARRY